MGFLFERKKDVHSEDHEKNTGRIETRGNVLGFEEGKNG